MHEVHIAVDLVYMWLEGLSVLVSHTMVLILHLLKHLRLSNLSRKHVIYALRGKEDIMIIRRLAMLDKLLDQSVPIAGLLLIRLPDEVRVSLPCRHWILIEVLPGQSLCGDTIG